MNSSRRDEGASVKGRRLLAIGAIAGVGVAGLVFGAGEVIGGIDNDQPAPATPAAVATVMATKPQAVSSGTASASASSTSKGKGKKKGKKTKVVYKNKPALFDSRISTDPVVTEEGKGSYVGLKCPKYFKAVAGGVLSQYINLVISSSSPNNPLTEEYTPNTWWLAVTNINTDGQGGSLSWRGVVSCIKPLKLQQG